MAAARGKEIAGVGIGSPGPLNTKTGIVLLTPISVGRTSRCASGWPARWICPPRSITTPTAPFSANGGGGRAGRGLCGRTHDRNRYRGGIVLGGKIYRGASDVAARSATCPSIPTAGAASCGNDGCLEAYASGPAIAPGVEGIETGADTSLRAM